MSVFATRLKEAITIRCEEEGINFLQMAESMGISASRLRHYCDRGSRPPSDTEGMIADRLRVDMNWLHGRAATMDWPKDEPMDQILSLLADLRTQVAELRQSKDDQER